MRSRRFGWMLAGCWIATCAMASTEDADLAALRKEFESYRQATEARIRALEEQLADRSPTAPESPGEPKTPVETPSEQAPDTAALSPEERAKIRELIDRATLDFEFHGYLRSGYGVDDRGRTLSPFGAPYAGAKYRLGNESDTYLETTFLTRTAPELSGEATFETTLTLAYSTPNSDNNDYGSDVSLREVYAVAKNVTDYPMSFWAGQRYYSRYDVHMSDFYYRDMSGYGGGVSDIALGNDFGKLSVAWLGGSIDDLDSDGRKLRYDQMNVNSLDTSLTDLPMPWGTLDAHFTLSYLKGGTIEDRSNHQQLEIEDGNGAACSLMYKIPVRETGKNVFCFQYGQGAAAAFRATLTAPNGFEYVPGVNDSVDTKELVTWRLLDNVVFDLNEKWSLRAAVIAERRELGSKRFGRVHWYSAGIRPIYRFNRYFSLATEAGYDYTDREDDASGRVFKLTVAPQITPNWSFLDRPSLRAYATYGWWSDAFGGEVAQPSYPTDRKGLSVGMQLESWW